MLRAERGGEKKGTVSDEEKARLFLELSLPFSTHGWEGHTFSRCPSRPAEPSPGRFAAAAAAAASPAAAAAAAPWPLRRPGPHAASQLYSCIRWGGGAQGAPYSCRPLVGAVTC